MNERIRELAEQAHCYACEYAQRPDYNPHNPYNQLMYKQRYDSKFAELIVREMCQVINDDCELQYSEGVITNLGGLNQARELIKEHFGVEEDEDEDEDDKTCPKCGDSWGGTSCGADCGWITGAEE